MSLKNRDRVSEGYIVDEMHRFNILLESREIFLHGYVDNVEEDPGVDYRMACNFTKNISLLERIDNTKCITVHQHSIGGDWTDGMMIYDSIQTCSAPVVIICHGIAASMGSIIPQAADLIISMPNCWWLIHDGCTDVSGHTMRQAKSWHEWEDKLTRQMMDIYVDVCSKAEMFKDKTEKQVQNYIRKQLDKKEDWWLSAQDAVSHGFSDGVFGTKGYRDLDEIKSHVC